MNKEKIITLIKALNVVAVAVVGLFLLFGAAYTVPAFLLNKILQLAALGYFLALVFGLLSFKKNYFLWLSLAGWLIFGVANMVDSRMTLNDNNNLCAELRADLACVEDECGFDCPEIITSGSICKDKDMSLCQEKTMGNIKPVLNEKTLRDAVFSAVEKFLKAKYEKTKDPGYAAWDEKIDIKKIDPSQKAAIGKWWAKDAWDWIAWQQGDGKWKVLVSLDGFDCQELREIPTQYNTFFRDIIYGTDGEKYCYDHSNK